MRVLDRLFACLYVAVLVVPVAAMLGHVKDHRIDGVWPPAPPPKLALSAVRSEDYQKGITAWFEGKLGLRNWSVWIDNSVLYHVFGETRFGSSIELGKDAVLFQRDDIEYFNRSGDTLPDQHYIDALADKIAALQTHLRRDHRAFVPLLVPSKTTVYRDKVAAAWTRDLGDPRPGTVHVYLALERALEARHVEYVDGIDLIMHLPLPRYLLWGPGARHWSRYAGCLVLREVLGRYAKLADRPAVDYPCGPILRPARKGTSDLDLYWLANAWGVPRDPLERAVDHPPPDVPGGPDTLIISGSFGWVLLLDAADSARFGKLHIDYYNRALHSMDAPPFDVHAHDDAWKAVFLTPDLYIVELNESYVTPHGYFIADAIDALAAELLP